MDARYLFGGEPSDDADHVVVDEGLTSVGRFGEGRIRLADLRVKRTKAWGTRQG